LLGGLLRTRPRRKERLIALELRSIEDTLRHLETVEFEEGRTSSLVDVLHRASMLTENEEWGRTIVARVEETSDAPEVRETAAVARSVLDERFATQ
jgi:hypothetical protein